VRLHLGEHAVRRAAHLVAVLADGLGEDHAVDDS
jgi:hypothetical protein